MNLFPFFLMVSRITGLAVVEKTIGVNVLSHMEYILRASACNTIMYI